MFFKKISFLLFFISSFFLYCQNDVLLDSLKNNFENHPNKTLKTIDKQFRKNTTLTSLDKARLFEIKGDILKNNQNLINAVDAYKSSFQLFKNTKASKSQIDVLNKMSHIYISLEKFPEVLDNQNEIIKLLNATNNEQDYSSKYTANLALTYFQTGDAKRAITYFHKSIQKAKNTNKFDLLHNHYKDLSRIFLKMNSLDSATYYSNLALNYSYLKGKRVLGSNVLELKGEIYEKEKEYIKAETHFINSIKTLDSIGINNTKSYIKLADFYERIGLHSFAHTNYRKAVEKTMKTGQTKARLSLYSKLIKNSLEHKKIKRSLYYVNKYNALQDVYEKEEEKRNMQYITDRYNMQEDEIVYLNQKNTLQEKEIELKIANKNKLLSTILLVLFGTLLLMALLFYRNKKLNNEKKFIHLKNTVLQLQMNPHFIFNSLTAIQNSILKKDNLKSAELIATFSKLIRQNLDYSNRETISLTEEIAMLKNYIETQQFRFNDLFSYDIVLDPKIDSDNFQIPPMLIQPFIENAIEHGLKHKEKDGKITIKISQVIAGVSIAIEDNGIGIASSKKYSMTNDDGKIHAIDIFKSRLKIRRKNEEKSFVLSDILQNGEIVGTKVLFTLKK